MKQRFTLAAYNERLKMPNVKKRQGWRHPHAGTSDGIDDKMRKY
jgi:hypothetical protein